MRNIRSAIGALALAAGLLAGTSAWAHDTTTSSTGTTTKTQGSLSGADKRFLRQAYGSATAELQIGQLASERGSTDAVKGLGKKIVDDESRQLAALKGIIEKNNLEVPKPEVRLGWEVRRLSRLHGPTFDKAFLAHERAHELAMLTEFQQESKAGKNADLQTYAGSQITVLRSHIDQARNVGVTSAQPKTSPQPKKK
jgi:putative membrane protein